MSAKKQNETSSKMKTAKVVHVPRRARRKCQVSADGRFRLENSSSADGYYYPKRRDEFPDRSGKRFSLVMPPALRISDDRKLRLPTGKLYSFRGFAGSTVTFPFALGKQATLHFFKTCG